MIYALSAFSIICLIAAVWMAVELTLTKVERDTYANDAEAWEKLAFDKMTELQALLDDMPERDAKTGRFVKRD